jgi:oxygen-independent coproporphyrinogen-3 oxidase
VRERVDQDAWRVAYGRELEYFRHFIGPRAVGSVFFGGGTPSLMPPETAGFILDKINDLWGLSSDIEVTLEANPGSSEIGKFKSFKVNGINRLSIGIQSLYDDQLRFLGRVHNAAEGMRAIEAARAVFDRFSFDLIYARPGQTPAQWEQELAQALTLAGDHMSLYQLTIEPQTPFFTAHARGDFVVPGEDVAAELYVMTDQMMAAAGRPAYEISNYAKPGQESQHNLTYWRYGDYVGVGPGAHGRLTVDGVKYATRGHRAPEIWLERVGREGHGMHPMDVVPTLDRGVEALMMGLRLNGGFDLANIARETGREWQEVVTPARIEALVHAGDLTTWALGPRIKSEDDPKAYTGPKITIVPTLQGRLRLNAVIAYLLGR